MENMNSSTKLSALKHPFSHQLWVNYQSSKGSLDFDEDEKTESRPVEKAMGSQKTITLKNLWQVTHNKGKGNCREP